MSLPSLERKRVSYLIDSEYSPQTDKDSELLLKTDNSKIKLNSIEELTSVVKTINDYLNSTDAKTTRAWVHTLRRIHPRVDSETNELEFFRPISNEIGTTYLQHTPDTASLALEDWETDKPNPFRRSIEHKIGDDYDRIRGIYKELNKALTRNLSTEFFYTDPGTAQKNQGSNYLNKSLLSNDFRIAGDFTFAEDHVSTLESTIMKAFEDYLRGATKLINWKTPINTFDDAINSGFTITVEGSDVVVDLKGNKVGVIASVIDTTPISVEESNK